MGQRIHSLEYQQGLRRNTALIQSRCTATLNAYSQKEKSMLEFLRALRRDRSFVARVPGLFLAFVIAEFLYKFHSFALECLAFLATWLVIDILCDRLFAKRSSASGTNVRD